MVTVMQVKRMRLIDADELKEHKFPIPLIGDYQQGWNDAIDAIVNNAPTAKSSFRHVILKHPRFGECDAIYDEARRLFYFDTITRELMDKYGWTFEEAENDK